MPLPKRRFSRSRRDKRRLQDHLTPATLSRCAQCGAPVISHRVCRSCGHYRGRKVMTVPTEESGRK